MKLSKNLMGGYGEELTSVSSEEHSTYICCIFFGDAKTWLPLAVNMDLVDFNWPSAIGTAQRLVDDLVLV